MKLYEITDILRDLMDTVSEPPPPEDAPADAHDDWLERRNAAMRALDEAGIDLKDKLRAYCAFAQELKVEREAREAKIAAVIANVIEPMRRQNARDEAKEKWLMQTAQAVIGQFDVPMPLKFGEFTVKLQKMPPSCVVDNADLLPAEYKRVIPATTEPDKRKILADLKEGVIIEGASLAPTSHKIVVK